MGVTIYPINKFRQTGIKKEKTKVLKVIGQSVSQLVLENTTAICAVKIDRINVRLGNTSDHFFKNKVVKQGTVVKDIFFVDNEGVLRFLTEEIPFILTIEIPGFKPKKTSEVQNHLLDIDVDFKLIPSACNRPACLKQIVVAHILVIASEWVQLDIITDIDQQVNTSTNSLICN